MKNQNYETPQLEVIEIEAEDVFCSTGVGDIYDSGIRL